LGVGLDISSIIGYITSYTQRDTTTMTILDPWESYNTRDGLRRIVVLDDEKRTTFTFEREMTPNYIVTNGEYGIFSFRNVVDDPDPLLDELVTIWRVL
jgi:hypothetical protein